MDFDEFLRLNGVKDAELSNVMLNKNNLNYGSDIDTNGKNFTTYLNQISLPNLV